jgi:hypothetical protein
VRPAKGKGRKIGKHKACEFSLSLLDLATPSAYTVSGSHNPELIGAVGTAIDRFVGLDAMPDNPAPAVSAHRGQGMNGALKAIESMRFAIHDDIERLVVLIAASFTACHDWFLSIHKVDGARRSSRRFHREG